MCAVSATARAAFAEAAGAKRLVCATRAPWQATSIRSHTAPQLPQYPKPPSRWSALLSFAVPPTAGDHMCSRAAANDCASSVKPLRVKCPCVSMSARKMLSVSSLERCFFPAAELPRCASALRSAAWALRNSFQQRCPKSMPLSADEGLSPEMTSMRPEATMAWTTSSFCICSLTRTSKYCARCRNSVWVLATKSSRLNLGLRLFIAARLAASRRLSSVGSSKRHTGQR
mmetsp:Transcript_53872/g.151401  ORF Transcript_53872/g.151401 Transcript_53872/m.151401 type:complete len:229 (+) Transcript_53872:191-877(+)